MKKGVVLVLILSVLFMGAILIYDFSDIPDEMLAGHEWYLVDNNEVYVLKLEDNKFSFKNKNSEEDRYQNCNTFKYNNSSNIIKLDCSIKNNKIYIATYDENKLVVTLNGEERTLYSSEELALEYKFIENNNLSEEKYNELFNLKFDDKYFINVDQFVKIYNGKSKINVVLVTSKLNYKNILDYVKLSKEIDNGYKLINIDSLSDSDIEKLYKYIGITEFEYDLVTIYDVCKRDVSIKEIIDVKSYKELM